MSPAPSPTALPASARIEPQALVLGAILLVACALAAVAMPLATYAAALAAFGWAHVVSELRYVDLRFGARLARSLRRSLAGLLLGVAVVRGASNAGMLARSWAVPVELCLVVAMTLAVVPALRHARPVARWAALLLAGALAAGIAWAPLWTLLLLAMLHNLTPVGFIAEVLDGPGAEDRARRRRALAIAAVPFLAVPALIATGIPQHGLAAIGLWYPELGVLGAGSLGGNMGAYLPRSVHGEPWAVPVFSAAVFGQCMHYAAVIYVLPRLLPARDREAQRPDAVVAWPRAQRFATGLTVFSLIMLAGFALRYGDARSVYSVAAAIHAWIELPVLLLALGAAGRAMPSTPAPAR